MACHAQDRKLQMSMRPSIVEFSPTRKARSSYLDAVSCRESTINLHSAFEFCSIQELVEVLLSCFQEGYILRRRHDPPAAQSVSVVRFATRDYVYSLVSSIKVLTPQW